MATELHGARHSDGAGVKVKFIETQFISSDAASFKSTVQRLTGKSALMPPPPPATTTHQPRQRPYRAGAFGNGEQGRRPCASGGNQVTVAPKQAAAFGTRRLEDLHELCDFADLLYATPGAQRDSGTFDMDLDEILY